MTRTTKAQDLTPMYASVIRGLYPVFQRITLRDWRGGQHVPSSGGVIIASNHLSWWDPFAVAHFLVGQGRAPHFLAKHGLWKYPVVRSVMEGTAQIPVYRGSVHAKDAFVSAYAALGEGTCVFVMPEGTLTKDPDLWPMTGKTGAARLALETGAPLVPVGIWGTQDVLYPYNGVVPRVWPRKTMHVYAGPPIDLDDLRGGPVTVAELRIATTRLMDAITELVAQARGEQPPQTRFDARNPRQ